MVVVFRMGMEQREAYPGEEGMMEQREAYPGEEGVMEKARGKG